MDVIAWIILGLVGGYIAERLVPSRNREGVIITTFVGLLGALLTGFIAYHVFHVVGIQGFFNASTWITAMPGAAVQNPGPPGVHRTEPQPRPAGLQQPPPGRPATRP